MRTILLTATLAATLAIGAGSAFAQSRSNERHYYTRGTAETTQTIPQNRNFNRVVPPSAATSQGFFPVDTTRPSSSNR